MELGGRTAGIPSADRGFSPPSPGAQASRCSSRRGANRRSCGGEALRVYCASRWPTCRVGDKPLDGAPASQHAGAPALVCALSSAARGRALYAKRRSLQRRVRRRPQIQASWRFKHVPSPCTLLFFATPDQRVALIKARGIMPAQFERRNARLYLLPAGGPEKDVDDLSRLGGTVGD